MNKELKIREKKKIIIEALKRCLAEDVYSRITVQKVADEAGFSKGGLLHYFSTKEDMYLELLDNLFSEIGDDHTRVLQTNLKTDERASISALYGIEKFVLDRKTIKILINLIMYGYEEEKIMIPLREFLRKYLNLYINLINEKRPDMLKRRKTDFDSEFIGRIAQVIVLGMGIFESIDPIEIDQFKLARYIIALLNG